MIYGFFIGFHVIICVTLVIVVLLQAGKGGGLAGAFGGGGGAGQTLFGGRGAATFLSKATTVLGIAFMSTSLLLALMSGGRDAERSILRDEPAPGTAPPVQSQPLQIPGAGDLPALDAAPVPTDPAVGEPTPPAGDTEGEGAGSGSDSGPESPGGN